jgi:hypothetical protein
MYSLALIIFVVSEKPLGRLEPNLAGMFLGWSSTKLLFFVSVGYSIICSDWLKFQRSSSLKSAKWFRRRSLKCEKFTDDGRQVMAIVHMDLWSRWTKNETLLVNVSNSTVKILLKTVWYPNSFKKRQKFSSTHTGEKFIIYCNANCKTENIIYLLECAICGLQYIGETKQLKMVWYPNSFKKMARHSVEYILWANRANCMS